MTLDERTYLAPVGVGATSDTDGLAPGVERDGVEEERTARVRCVAAIALVTVLVAAVWTQRSTVAGALDQMGRLSLFAVVALGALTIFERWSRADIVRRLLGDPVSLGCAVTVHDVGTAVSKGVPLGGALGTAMRWTIVRDSDVRSTRFATMLIAYGIATTFVTWLLPFAALIVDLTQRSPRFVDILILAVIASVVVASATFWMVVLRSERLELWAAGRLRRIWTRLANRVTALDSHDPATGVAEVRRELHEIARRPWALLGRTLVAQACGSVILLVALRSLGVGDELATTEFFRVFFITHLLGTFAPTPGGVGVVEAGATGALVAAGVETSTALAGVLVYRFLTYVVPIAFGALLYLVWRVRRTRGLRAIPATSHGHVIAEDSVVQALPGPDDRAVRSRRLRRRPERAVA